MSPSRPPVNPAEIAKRMRIQRTSVWDEFVERDLQIWRCRNILNASHRGQHIVLKYSKSRLYRLDGGYRRVRQRELFCLIYLNTKVVGAFEMTEIDVSDADPQDLVGAMDSVSQYAYELGQVIRRGWKFLPAIWALGTILDFRRVWMDPAHARTGLWAEAARKVIDTEFPKYAVMVMKAFPLEYEGMANAANAVAFKRRQRAMRRYYGSLFGVKPFPGRDGQEGWLWRAHPRWEGIIDGPASPTGYL